MSSQFYHRIHVERKNNRKRLIIMLQGVDVNKIEVGLTPKHGRTKSRIMIAWTVFQFVYDDKKYGKSIYISGFNTPEGVTFKDGRTYFHKESLEIENLDMIQTR